MQYFTTPTISLGFFSAISASAFIYMSHLGLHAPWLQAFLGMAALFAWLRIPVPAMAWSGFFTGIFWFWWIGMSFRYYDLGWMIPLIVLSIGGVYGIVFWLLSLLRHPLMRAAGVGLIEFLHPFGFDWFRPALLFTGSVLGDSLWQLWTVLAALALFLSFRHPGRYAALLLIPLALHRPPAEDLHSEASALKRQIQLTRTNIDQGNKWKPRYRNAIVELNLHAIDLAVEQGKRAVILPESAFPLYLNLDIDLIRKLLKMSRRITIVTGALYYEKGNAYNSTYLFRKEKLRVMHKVVLVPFGEAVPLPKWIGHWINDLFFDGASDYRTASRPSDFEMLGRKWRNAICYEATCERLYEEDPRYMVALSNNAWFIPSTEPTLQRLLLQLQANRHKTIIFHATNGPITDVIVPQ
ncbi:apolipoprotein N-acyltransferase [Hydrogenimonas urashimensis]|uniref:apolipoprotein N-acyltransferase n=1 Tax=Hydrogenimonas urashimensis TaxID=2740515 RepID=UPI001915B26A|nr:apolipoprotein N-acyltransferase [Hydrogenimonas urashimensis]